MTRETAGSGLRPQDDGLVTCALELLDLDCREPPPAPTVGAQAQERR